MGPILIPVVTGWRPEPDIGHRPHLWCLTSCHSPFDESSIISINGSNPYPEGLGELFLSPVALDPSALVVRHQQKMYGGTFS